MRQEGVVTRWEDVRGFGFVTPVAGGSQFFLHISELPQGAPRPVVGDVVTFQPGRDGQNRPRALWVQYPASERRTSIAGGVLAATLVGVACFVGLGILTVLRVLPGAVIAVSGLASVAVFVLYEVDKSAATRGAWRIGESTLHLVSLLGGWPGALLAQQVFRHKTRKQSFQVVLWVTVVVNVAMVAWLAISHPIPF